jgi:uncharacterized protein YcbK (DUF882 family)
LNTSFDAGSQVPLKTAHGSKGYHRSLRLGGCAGLAGILILLGSQSLQNATANGDTRSLTLRHTHTNEKLTITYKVNGRYDDEALKKLNHVLRDWREDQAISMDPHLLDLIWDVYREVEATEPIAIVCGYRSPGTNAMLRRRSSGVAKFSQHMLGKAMDFYIPGVPLERLREAGLRASRGGVGFYPSSNFVHLDTGSVRHWPRMPEAELAKVMAKGPIKGPLTAVASRKTDTKVASSTRIPNPFAKLFGSGEEEEDAETIAATAPAARTAEAKKPAAKANDKSAKTHDKTNEKSAERPAVVAAAATPAPATRPAQQGSFDLASASSRPVELRPARAAGLVNGGDTSANAVISERGFWPSSPDNSAQQSAAAQSAAAATAGRIASADSTSSTPWPAPDRAATGTALSYAPASHPASPSRPAAASASTASTSSATRTTQAAPSRDTTVAAKRAAEPAKAATPAAPATTAQSLAAALAQAKAGQQFNDPWMRAMIVAPSAGGFMSTSLLGTTDFRALSPYLQKPSSSVMMTFANDPYLGMSTQRFAGTAVVFVSTVTFSRRTASLR